MILAGNGLARSTVPTLAGVCVDMVMPFRPAVGEGIARGARGDRVSEFADGRGSRIISSSESDIAPVGDGLHLEQKKKAERVSSRKMACIVNLRLETG